MVYVWWTLGGGWWWLIDVTSTKFWSILLFCGGYLKCFSILLDCLWELFWELIIEITQSLSINEYWGQELFTHFCIKFSSKPFEGYGIVHLGICLLFLLASIHLEGFGIQQGLHFPEKLILLPYFFVFQAWTISLAGNFKCLAFLRRSPADK